MSSFRIIKRGVLFGVDGDNIANLEALVGSEGTVAQSGQPVAVLFGTRAIDPVVVAWGSLGGRIVNYYDPNNETQTPRFKPFGDDDYPLKMVNLTMRMVLCAGKIDGFSSWTAGGLAFRVLRQLIPATSDSGHEVQRVYYSQFDNQAGIERFVVAVGDIDLFGGGEAGGLGFAFDRGRYNETTQYKQFWFSTSQAVTDPRLDASVQYRGLSSLYFRYFNFGGNLPPPSWKVTATRIDSLTARTASTNDYKDQWTPRLATISTIPYSRSGIYYLFVFSPVLTRDQRRQMSEYIQALPFDDNTAYQFISQGEATAGADGLSTTSAIFTDRTTVLGYLAGVVAGAPSRRPTNFTRTQAEQIFTTYADRAVSSQTIERQEVGIVIVFTTDVFGVPRGLSSTNPRLPGRVNSELIGALLILSHFNYTVAENISSTFAFVTESRRLAVSKNPPDMRLALWSYFDGTRYVNDPYPYNKYVLRTTAGNNDLRNLNSLDAYRSPIVVGGSGGSMSTDEFTKQFRTILPVGKSMNPIHALRETLTNGDWGKGIDESLIDDSSFLVAAQTCYDEKLDFCYLHRGADPNPIIKQITDYVEGITYYNPVTNKVMIKLIRNDYSIGDLPSFDESSISMVSGFKRQQANRLVNAVTVKYHNVSLGTDETVSIHDLESTSEQQAARTANISLPGCATREAAVRVASRELSALSKSVLSCIVRINPSQPLGLGDPIVISYRDLGLARIVMRVTKIDYGNGLTGGIDVSLIQDVFSEAYYVGLVGDVELPDEPERLADLSSIIKFLEMSAYDLAQVPVSSPFSVNSNARYFKLGRADDPLTNDTTVVTYNGQRLPVSIGTLQTPILSLTDAPFRADFEIIVSIPDDQQPLGNFIRIDDEIFEVALQIRVDAETVRLTINNRALRDTVAVSHAVGADVWFLDRLIVNGTPWDGTALTVSQTQDGFTDQEQLTPNLSYISRGRLPLPPRWVTVDSKYIPRLIIDGDIVVRFQGRASSAAGDFIVVRLTKGDTELYRQATTLGSLVGGSHALQSQTISTATLTSQLSSGAHYLSLSVDGLTSDGLVNSWQSWVYTINWSATVREHTGWTYNWGNKWGSGQTAVIIDGQPTFARGWDFDFDENWDV